MSFVSHIIVVPTLSTTNNVATSDSTICLVKKAPPLLASTVL